MEFKSPKPKKHVFSQKCSPLPSQDKNEILGVFNGQHVTITDWDSMNRIYNWGNFGKGSLSKSAPIFHIKKDDIPKLVLEEQFKNHTKWEANVRYSCPKKYSNCLKSNLELSNTSVNNFLQSTFNSSCIGNETWRLWKKNQQINPDNPDKNDSDTDSKNNSNCVGFLQCDSDENNTIDPLFSKFVNEILCSKEGKKWKTVQKSEEEFIVVNTNSDPKNNEISVPNLDARLERLPYFAEENLNLSLEEAFFLKFVCGCLKIVDLNLTELSVTSLWEKFNEVQRNFLERYVIYHYYRTKGWVVKSGLKYGGDYLLYKDGPAFYHASYLIKVLDKKKTVSWREFIAMNRLVETFNKDLVLCNVLHNDVSSSTESFPEALKNYSVQEVLARRWFPSKERFSKDGPSS